MPECADYKEAKLPKDEAILGMTKAVIGMVASRRGLSDPLQAAPYCAQQHVLSIKSCSLMLHSTP